MNILSLSLTSRHLSEREKWYILQPIISQLLEYGLRFVLINSSRGIFREKRKEKRETSKKEKEKVLGGLPTLV